MKIKIGDKTCSKHYGSGMSSNNILKVIFHLYLACTEKYLSEVISSLHTDKSLSPLMYFICLNKLTFITSIDTWMYFATCIVFHKHMREFEQSYFFTCRGDLNYLNKFFVAVFDYMCKKSIVCTV